MPKRRNKKNSRRDTKWKWYEKIVAKKHRGRHIGGPGKPDYLRGDNKGEVKYWDKPLPKSVVMELAKKGVSEIVSKSGFTKPAINYVKRYRPYIKLFHGTKRIN